MYDLVRYLKEPISTVWPPGNRFRRYGHRGTDFDGTATGEPISMVRPSGNRFRRYGHRGTDFDGTAIGEPISTVWPPGNRFRWYGHRGTDFDGTATGEPISTVWPPEIRPHGPTNAEKLSSVRLPQFLRLQSLIGGSGGSNEPPFLRECCLTVALQKSPQKPSANCVHSNFLKPR